MTDDQKIPNVVVIPTRDHADTLCCDLITQLLDQDETDKIFVYDNRNSLDGVSKLRHEWPGAPVIVFSTPSWTITKMWNHGWASALVFGLDGPVNVAFLNDDIVILPGFIGTLAARVREDPYWLVCPDWMRSNDKGDESRLHPTRPVQGTARNLGVCGWAFMLRGELLGAPLPPIDEQFIHWCGDDDLVKQIDLHGGVCGQVDGLPLNHLGSMTTHLHPELHEIGWEDVKRFEEKYK